MESRPLLSSSEVRASRAATLRLYASAVICSLTPLSYGVCLGYTAPAFPDMKKDNFITDNQVCCAVDGFMSYSELFPSIPLHPLTLRHLQ